MKKRPSAPSSGARSPLPGLLSALPPEVLSGLITSLTAGRSGQNPPANAPFAPGQRPPSGPGPASGSRNAPDGGGNVPTASHGQQWREGPPNPDFPNPKEHAFRDLLLRHEALSRKIDRDNRQT